MNPDLTAFIDEISWFFQEKDTVEIEEKSFDFSADFKLIFPKLTRLIESARKTHLRINNIPHILFAWNNMTGEIFGWLNKIESLESFPIQLSKEHKLLLQNIGGIQESFNQPEDSLTNNQNFMFIGSECNRGIGAWDEYYKEVCNEEKIEPLNHSNLIRFVEEANGNMTLYDSTSNDILLFASDHCFDYVKPVAGQPEYTFYQYDSIATFTDYVEKLAGEWMAENANS